jgi:hypothetical protein
LQHLPIIDWNSAEQHRSYLDQIVPRPGCLRNPLSVRRSGRRTSTSADPAAYSPRVRVAPARTWGHRSRRVRSHAIVEHLFGLW